LIQQSDGRSYKMAITLGGSAGGDGPDKLNFLSPASGLKIALRSAYTYTPSINCTAVVTLIGAGASGYAIANYNIYRCAGGGAGGVCQSELSLTAGTSYTFAVGAGGTGNGTAGGNTTLTGSDITDMAANGGAAPSLSGGTSALTIAGGTATGGNICNFAGGGSIINSGVTHGAGGGGACGFFEAGLSSTQTSNSGVAGAGIQTFPTNLIANGDIFIEGTGGSSGSSQYLNGYNYAVAGDGSFGCGGGGAYVSTNRNSSSGYVHGGNGGIGGGGGGAVGYNANASYNISASPGKGGDGIVLIEFV
jgi:hypothetical protein